MDVREGIFALLVNIVERRHWTDQKSGATVHAITVKGYGLTKTFISEDVDQVSQWPMADTRDVIMKCSVELQGKEGRFQLLRPSFESAQVKKPAAA
jgi:hypothetical protein